MATTAGNRKDAKGKPIIKSAPTERVYRLIDEAWDIGYRGTINFHHLSEPFLDKRLITFARYAKDKGVISSKTSTASRQSFLLPRRTSPFVWMIVLNPSNGGGRRKGIP